MLGTFFCSILSWFLEVCKNQVFLLFENNSRSKQNKKSPKQPFVEIIGKYVQNFSKRYLTLR